MNIAYFRKSKYDLIKTAENVTKFAKDQGWKVLSEADIPDTGKMILICRADWVKELVKEEHQLIGFLPCSITIFKKDDDVLIGTGQPTIIKALAQNDIVAGLASNAEKQIKELIHQSAGVDELKPKNIKLYSTMSCPYCKMEKSWLDSKNIKHEVVYVDLNQDEAEKMVARTGQMGVPVTEVQFEEGEPEIIIGFDRDKLSQILNV